MSRSKLVLLNGTSSSGKTSIARALQEVAAEPYMCFSSDILEEYVHPRFRSEWAQQQHYLPALLQGHFYCMAALVKTGNWVVADAVLEEPILVAEAAKALSEQEAFLVGVHCQIAELERRELERGDRTLGMAKGQLERVHQHGLYDFEVDTTTFSAKDCAAQIAGFLAEGPKPEALARLRAEQGSSSTAGSFSLDWW